MISRRGLITGLASLLAAPAIVSASSLMPVKVMTPAVPPLPDGWVATTENLIIRVQFKMIEMTEQERASLITDQISMAQAA